MSRFEKAPLVYVSLKINTSTMPTLNTEQSNNILEAMSQYELSVIKKSAVNSFHIKNGNSQGAEISLGKEVRTGYFNISQRSALIFNENGIEYRTTEYTEYEELITKVKKIVQNLQKFAGIDQVEVKELSLSYVDIIVPLKERKVSDYFNKDFHLPFDTFGAFDKKSLQIMGYLELNRIVTEKEKVDIVLEQYPVVQSDLPVKFPRSLGENDPEFFMPTTIHALSETLKAKSYLLWLTKVDKLVEKS